MLNMPLTSEDISARQLAIQAAGGDIQQALAIYEFLTAEDPRPSAPVLHISRDEEIRQQYAPPVKDGTRTDTTEPNYLHPSYGPQIAQAALQVFKFITDPDGDAVASHRSAQRVNGYGAPHHDPTKMAVSVRSAWDLLAAASAQADLLYGE